MDGPIIDIHCHTFNGDDLPVRGFIEHVGPHHAALGSVLARLLDAVVQSGAPGYESERARLDGLLESREAPGLFAPMARAALAPDPQRQLDDDAQRALEELTVRSGPLVRDVGQAMQNAYQPEAPIRADVRGFGPLGLVERAVKWVLLFGRYRMELTQLLISNFGDRVDLFCPLSLDLGTGLGDQAKTTGRQQIELQEKISRLTMRGDLPNGGKARIHPFVAFDPLHEIRARAVHDIETPFTLLQTAIECYGFVGVKLYPPMGWRPIGNATERLMPPGVGEPLDAALRDLYGWCEEKQVPVTAHCNRSNFADERLADLAGPDGWIDVLTEFPALHLNLAHFGGVYETRSSRAGHDWPERVARAAGRFEHLFVDVGDQPISDDKRMTQYAAQLEAFFGASDTAAVRDRIMFGSDWFMEALHPEASEFLTEYEAFFQRWGADDVTGFLGTRALRFLGFDDPSNQNAMRLRARYAEHARNRVPPWLAQP